MLSCDVESHYHINNFRNVAVCTGNLLNVVVTIHSTQLETTILLDSCLIYIYHKQDEDCSLLYKTVETLVTIVL